MDRLRTIEVFARVLELGSFSRAAAALRLPPATVTEAVQALEARLGARLLHRTTRRVTPTADGVAYHAEVTRLLRDLEDLEAALTRRARVVEGRVRVDVAAAAGRHLLAPALPGLLARHPGLVVELGSSDRPVDLVGEGVDCVIRGGEVHDESLVARRLGVLPVITCAAPAYLARRGTPTHPDELGGHDFVNFFSPKSGRVFEVDFAREGVERAFVPSHQVAANDTDTWVALAAAGLGLLQTPASRGVRERVCRGELVRVLPDWTSGALPLYVLYPQKRHLAERVRAFVDWAVELFSGECAEAARFVDRDEGAVVASPNPEAP